MNSLTANNRLPQLRGIPVHGTSLFRYERMVSGRWIPCNHSRAIAIVGVFQRRAKRICEHSTDGLKTATASQSGLSGGSQKLNGLYTCATDTSMSASVLSNSFSVNSGK